VKRTEPDDRRTEPLPAAHTTIPLDRLFTVDDVERIQRGLIPEEMEDKWFIYWLDGMLHCCRSWTGYCIYLVSFASEGDWLCPESSVSSVAA